MKKAITEIILLITAITCFGQIKISDKDFNNLIKTGELYYGEGKLITQERESKKFYKQLEKLRTPELENLINTFAAIRSGKNDILDEKYLKRPENKDLIYWYVIREIFYNMNDSNNVDNKIIADSVLNTPIDERALLDNYYYRIRSGINLDLPNDLSSFNYDIENYGFKNEREKAIFFFNMTTDICNRMGVLQMTKNYSKSIEYIERHPKINGEYFYKYKSFNHEDFQWIGYKDTEWYNQRHLRSFYNGLYFLYLAIEEEKGKSEAGIFYDNTILSMPEYFGFSGNSNIFQKMYSVKKEKSKFFHGFDMEKFNKYAEQSSWLYEYDAIAWWTSDSVLTEPESERNKLGTEWFCFRDENKTWHAVYGKFADNKYDVVFHYEVDTNYVVRKTQSDIDTAITYPLARAMSKINLDTIVKIQVRHNSYVQQNDDNEIEIWYFPAFQTDNTAIWGSEYWFKFDSTGNKLLDSRIINRGYWGVKPDENKEITIDYIEYETPPPGAIFFAWYYRKFFKKITINRKFGQSSPFYNENNGNEYWNWIHTDDRE